MNQRILSRLERLEQCATLEVEPLVIVSRFADGRCLAQGQDWPNLEAVQAAHPLALLIVGDEQHPNQ